MRAAIFVLALMIVSIFSLAFVMAQEPVRINSLVVVDKDGNSKQAKILSDGLKLDIRIPEGDFETMEVTIYAEENALFFHGDEITPVKAGTTVLEVPFVTNFQVKTVEEVVKKVYEREDVVSSELLVYDSASNIGRDTVQVMKNELVGEYEATNSGGFPFKAALLGSSNYVKKFVPAVNLLG
jgi:hypothetical protein